MALTLLLAVHPTDLRKKRDKSVTGNRSGKRIKADLDPISVEESRRVRDSRNKGLKLRDTVLERHRPAVVEVEDGVVERQTRHVHGDLDREVQLGGNLGESAALGDATGEGREGSGGVEMAEVLLDGVRGRGEHGGGTGRS